MSLDAGQIAQALASQGIGEDVATVRVAVDGTPSLAFSATATQQQQTTALNALAGLDLSPAGEAARQIVRNRTDATTAFQASTPLGQILRAEALVLIDEINALREWITSFKAATAAATSLANLQTRVAALASMPDRTASQAKTAIVAKAQDTASDA